MTEPRALVLQHDPRFGLGVGERELVGAGLRPIVVDGPSGDMPPRDTTGLACLVSLGGTMSANSDDEHPWMRRELLLMEEAIREGVPVLGLGLGARLLARANGWRVGQLVVGGRPWMEAGWATTRRLYQDSADDLGLGNCLGALPLVHDAFHFHWETVLPGPGARVVAASDADPCQAFEIGGKHVGLQFMVEADGPAVMAIVDDHSEFLESCGIPPSRVTVDTLRRCNESALYASQLFSRFFTAAAEGRA